MRVHGSMGVCECVRVYVYDVKTCIQNIPTYMCAIHNGPAISILWAKCCHRCMPECTVIWATFVAFVVNCKWTLMMVWANCMPTICHRLSIRLGIIFSIIFNFFAYRIIHNVANECTHTCSQNHLNRFEQHRPICWCLQKSPRFRVSTRWCWQVNDKQNVRWAGPGSTRATRMQTACTVCSHWFSVGGYHDRRLGKQCNSLSANT